MRLPAWLRVVRSRRQGQTIELELEVERERLRETLERFEQRLSDAHYHHVHMAMDAAVMRDGQIGDFQVRPGGRHDHDAWTAYLNTLRIFDGPYPEGYARTADEGPGVLLEDLLDDIDKELGQ